jgi:alpha-glucosidase
MRDDWWRGTVTYQVYPRSFQDDNGDGIGDLPGITRRLPYLADLGADAIWLSPFFTSPMKDFGYDVENYVDVDPVFGTLADFDALIARAHQLGLRVVIDQVLAHCADTHPAFTISRSGRDNPRADWFVWADPRPDGTAPNNWLSVFGGIAWTWDARRRQYYMHNFLPAQPQFNFWNPEVQDFHLQNMRFWLDRGVDGFRLDTVNYFFHDRQLRDDAADYRAKTEPEANPYGMQYHLFSKNQPENLAWLARVRALLDGYGARMTVGEVGESHHAIRMMGEYTGPGLLHQAYSFEMLGPDFSAWHFRSKVQEFFAGAPDGWPMWAFSNHDVPRHVGRWTGPGMDAADVARQAAALLLALPGSICLWQGEELGQVDATLGLDELVDPQGIAFWPAPVGRDGTRVPMMWETSAPNGGFSQANRTWLPVKPPQVARAVDTQAGQAGSVLEFYRAMIALRRARGADMQGAAIGFADLPEPLLAFTRGQGTTCIYNLSALNQTVTLSGDASILLGGAAVPRGRALALGPSGFVILDGAVRVSAP